MATKLSAKEAAKEIGTDARTLRKFIRSAKDLPIQPVGQGARYEFSKAEVKALKKRFVEWANGTAPKTKKVNGHKIETENDEADIEGWLETNASSSQKITEEDLDEDEKELDLEDLEGPDDEELMEIEDIELD